MTKITKEQFDELDKKFHAIEEAILNFRYALGEIESQQHDTGNRVVYELIGLAQNQVLNSVNPSLNVVYETVRRTDLLQNYLDKYG